MISKDFIKTFAVCSALTAFGGAGTAQAADLDYCPNADGAADYLCGTAIEFGAYAGAIRDELLFRSRRLGGPQAQKFGGGPWTGSVGLVGQTTSGNFTGWGNYLLLGADTQLGPNTTVGVLVNVGKSSLTVPGGTVLDRSEVLAGPMFITAMANGGVLAGQLQFGRPDYEVNAVPSTGESFVGSLIYSRSIDRSGIDLTPFVALSVKREWPNATDRVDATILTVGTSLDGEVARTSNGYRQFFGRVEMDVGNYSDTLGNPSISYIAPRLGAGARFAFDGGGTLQLQANVSMASDQTTIVAAQAVYRFEF